MSHPYIDAIRKAGVVGAGGGGFPTHVKLDTSVEVLIANGAECEPLLRHDQQTMDKYASEVLRGIEIVTEITGAQKSYIGLKKKYYPAIKTLKSELNSKKDGTELFLLDDYYPAGDEFVLVHEILGRNIPEAGLPLHVGTVVNNVGTLVNITRAVDEGKPVVTRLVTVTGAVRNPKVIAVPIGTPISEVINAAGGTEEDPFSVIMGGPMMGVVATDLNQPITKIDNGLIVLSTSHPLIQKKIRTLSYDVNLTKAACIRCNLCTEICPRYLLGHRLEPDKIMRAVAYSKTDGSDAIMGAFLCTGCGVCTHYGCVMELDPARVNLEFKDRLITENVKNPFTEHRELHPDQELRKVPTKRLIGRLGLYDYEKDAPLVDYPLQVDFVRIPLKQHTGAPAKPVVKQGTHVNCGDLIGKLPENTLGANVHASIDGRVVEISDYIAIQS